MPLDTLSAHGAAAGKAQPAPLMRGTCLLCHKSQVPGRSVAPRKGLPQAYCCFACIPRRTP